MIKISVIICTHNGSKYLAKALESLKQQFLSKNQFEIIVVDNQSTDNTKSIVEDFQNTETNIRYIYENRLGLSTARNTGWQNANGKYVAFLDDDAIACPNWLEELTKTFENTLPTPSSIGGKILPIWEIKKPDWFPDQYLSSLTILDLGEEPKFIASPLIPFGANMSFKIETLETIGGFNPKFTYYGDDQYIFDKLREQGGTIYYQPKAIVHHLVSEVRLKPGYICKRKYLGGKAELKILFERKTKKRKKLQFLLLNIIGRPFQIMKFSSGYLYERSKGVSTKSMEKKILLYRSSGCLIQSWQLLFTRDWRS